mgnify:FL=1
MKSPNDYVQEFREKFPEIKGDPYQNSLRKQLEQFILSSLTSYGQQEYLRGVKEGEAKGYKECLDYYGLSIDSARLPDVRDKG